MVSSKIKTLPETFCGVPRLMFLIVILGFIFVMGFLIGGLLLNNYWYYQQQEMTEKSFERMYDICNYANFITNISNEQTLILGNVFQRQEELIMLDYMNCSIYKR